MNKPTEKAVKKIVKLERPAAMIAYIAAHWDQPQDFTLSFRVSYGCNPLPDLERCIEVIGGWNDFRPKKIKRTLAEIDLLKFLTQGGQVTLGLENSPVMYFKIFNYNKGYTRKFKSWCKKFAKATSANECDFFRISSTKTICRVWWN